MLSSVISASLASWGMHPDEAAEEPLPKQRRV